MWLSNKATLSIKHKITPANYLLGMYLHLIQNCCLVWYLVDSRQRQQDPECWISRILLKQGDSQALRCYSPIEMKWCPLYGLHEGTLSNFRLYCTVEKIESFMNIISDNSNDVNNGSPAADSVWNGFRMNVIQGQSYVLYNLTPRSCLWIFGDNRLMI